MRIVRHEGIPDSQTFREQWDGLVHAMERPQVFYTFEWAQAVARAFGGTLKPLIFAGYRGEDLVGVVALAEDVQRKEASFLTASTADYCDFISSTADRKEFIEGVMEQLYELDLRLSLASLPADAASADVLRSSGKKVGYSIFSRPAYLCAQVPLETESQRAQTRKSVRTKLRRMSNATAGHGPLVTTHESDWNGFATEFPEFAIAHVQRFLAAGRVSNLGSQKRRTFLLELGKLLSAQGWLTLSTLKLSGRTIAWNYGFRFGGSWFWYQPAFDTEMAQLSPGSYLLCEILRRASDDPLIHTVDLGLGDEGYKDRYAKAGRQTLHITACSPGRKAVEVCRYRAAQFVRGSPRLESALRGCLAKVTGIRANISRNGIAKTFKDVSVRFRRSIAGANEVMFFEWAGPEPVPHGFALQPLSLRLLANAAMAYEADSDTLNYLLRGAQRLSSGRDEGFALTTPEGIPVHFCWVSRFEGFTMSELHLQLREPAAQAVLLFDCWTPQSQRGQGYYGVSISNVAARLIDKGKRPWIFSGAMNVSSLRGIEKGGFVLRFSLKRRKLFGVTKTSKITLDESNAPRMDLFPAA
jgi:CelD/BcsL family acetyltransferase involved in cellulose biosynthesis